MRIVDHALLDRQRQRLRILRHRHGRVFEQVPLVDPHAAAGARLPRPGPMRQQAHRPASKHALLVEPEHILRQRHARGEFGDGHKSIRLNVQGHTGADRRQRPLVRPQTTGLSRNSSTFRSPAGLTTSPARSGMAELMTAVTVRAAASTASGGAE